MTSTANVYDSLYNNLKNSFTAIYEGRECTVGEYMRNRAAKAENASLPVATVAEPTALATIAEYVTERLTVKAPPAKDRTIRRFPLRTSMSALLSAVAACALVVSCGIFTLMGSRDAVAQSSAEVAEQAVTSTEIPEEVQNN